MTSTKNAPAPKAKAPIKTSTKAKVNKKGALIATGTDKDGKEIYNLVMPDYAPGTPVSVGFVDKHSPCGFNYEAAWILAQMPTKDTEMNNYKVTFGKKSKRAPMVVPLTSIHAACLAGKRAFSVCARVESLKRK